MPELSEDLANWVHNAVTVSAAEVIEIDNRNTVRVRRTMMMATCVVMALLASVGWQVLRNSPPVKERVALPPIATGTSNTATPDGPPITPNVDLLQGFISPASFEDLPSVEATLADGTELKVWPSVKQLGDLSLVVSNANAIAQNSMSFNLHLANNSSENLFFANARRWVEIESQPLVVLTDGRCQSAEECDEVWPSYNIAPGDTLEYEMIVTLNNVDVSAGEGEYGFSIFVLVGSNPLGLTGADTDHVDIYALAMNLAISNPNPTVTTISNNAQLQHEQLVDLTNARKSQQ